MKVSPAQLWQQSLQLIKGNVSEQQFETWFKPIVFVSYSPATMTILVQVPSPFVYEYLEENFVDLIGKALKRYFGQNVRLTYRVVTDKTNDKGMVLQSDNTQDQIEKPLPRENANQSYGVLDASRLQPVDPQLNPQQTFENFIEGDSNKLPRAVGLSIAQNPSTTQFNPMFVFGPSGCGKTHLINAIGVRIKKLYPQKRVLYVSARLFQVQYTNAVRQNKVNDFISYYQTIDVLIIDDTQELAGLGKTQNTFFHIFNHLHLNNKQIILTADRPPMAIQGLEERLLTRFKWGLQAEIERPTKALCRAILRHKVSQDNIPMPEVVINYIADRVDGSVRDLEGIINSLMAYSVVYKCDINMRLADKVLPRFIHIDNKPITIADIKQHLCKHYGISETELCSQSRRQPINQIRQTAAYLASRLTDCSNTQIGENIGGRTHATVLHSIKHIQELIDTDNKFRKEVEDLEDAIKRR